MPRPKGSESGSTNSNRTSAHEFYRSDSNKMLAGVAGGVAEYFNTDPVLIRIIFILLTIFNGVGILIYLALWLIMPSRSQATNPGREQIRHNVDEIKEQAAKFAQDFRFSRQTHSAGELWGGVLVVLGILFLLGNFGLFDILQLDRFWPILLIIIGTALLVR